MSRVTSFFAVESTLNPIERPPLGIVKYTRVELAYADRQEMKRYIRSA